MAWIEVHQSLLTHRKTLRLCRLLKMDKYAVTGRLMALWCWALDNAQDGALPIGDIDILGDVMGWEGDYHELIDALLASGFVDRSESGLQIHNWDNYAGKLVDRRERNKLSMRAAREREKAERVQHVYTTSEPRDDTCKATVPNHTVPNSTQPYSSAVSVNGYQKSSSSKPAPAGKTRASARTTTTFFELTYPEKARWVADVPDDLAASWTKQDRQTALEDMLAKCKDMHWTPHEKNYHRWLRDEKHHIPENASEVEKLEAILASYDKETGKCSNGQTYTNNLEKLRSAREREQADRYYERQEQRRSAEAELVLLEPSDTEPPPNGSGGVS